MFDITQLYFKYPELDNDDIEIAEPIFFVAVNGKPKAATLEQMQKILGVE